MIIKKAVESDIDAMAKIYRDAQTALRTSGVDQWQDVFPSSETASRDIANGSSYVLWDNGRILGTASVSIGEEPTYRVIRQGEWLSTGEVYGFLHRVAVAEEAKGRGAAAEFFKLAEKLCRESNTASLRCDTHRDNLPMQRALLKYGFSRCGIIDIENGAERVAFEKIV